MASTDGGTAGNREIGARLRAERERAGYTQEAVAEKLGMSPQSISLWETGKRPVKLSKLAELARLYRVTDTYLLKGADPDRSWLEPVAVRLESEPEEDRTQLVDQVVEYLDFLRRSRKRA